MNNHEVFRLCREQDSPGVDQYSDYIWFLLNLNPVNISYDSNLMPEDKKILFIGWNWNFIIIFNMLEVIDGKHR